MRIIVNNSDIVIQDAEYRVIAELRKHLTCQDKSIMYQIKRLSANPVRRNSAYVEKLKKQVTQCLLEQIDDRTVRFPSGFAYLIRKSEFEDKRVFSGQDIKPLPWINKTPTLRDYQQEAVDLIERNYRGLINCATGLGKTLIAIHAIRRVQKKTLVVCPSRTIANQFLDQLETAFGKNRVGFIGEGTFKIADITVGIAASVTRKTAQLAKEEFGLVMFDETHHIAARTFASISSALASVGRMFGLTATSFRSDGKDLLITAGVGPILIERDAPWGIANGYLAKPVFLVREVYTKGHSYRDNKLKNYQEHVVNQDSMNKRLLEDAKTMMESGKATLILVDSIEHGQMLSDMLQIPFAHGEEEQSDRFVDMLNKGKVKGLVGTVGRIGEGCDTKRVDVLIMAHFAASKGIIWQTVGRGLRMYEGKKQLIVLDYIPTGSDMLKRHAYQRLDYYYGIHPTVHVKYRDGRLEQFNP